MALSNSPEELHAIGVQWLYDGEYSKAVGALSECLRQNPQNASAYYYRAQAYRGLGKTDLAEADDIAQQSESSEEDTTQILIDYTAKRLLEGATTVQVAEELADNDNESSKEDYLPFVAAVYRQLDKEANSAISDEYKKRIVSGLLWMIGGGAVSLITYLAASGGGTYLIFWGAVVWGGIDLLRGIAGWLEHR